MLKNLDQSVDLLCDFYNLDFQLDERIKVFVSGESENNVSPNFNTETVEDIKEALDKDDDVDYLSTLLRGLLGAGLKRFIGRRDRDRINRFMNSNFSWGGEFTFEMWLAGLRKVDGYNWFTDVGVLELLYDFHTIRCFIRDILQNRISEDVMLRIGDIFEQIGELELTHWDLQPRKQDYGQHSYKRFSNMLGAVGFVADMDEEFTNLMKVSNGKGFWELDDVKWEVNTFRLMLGSDLYRIPMGFIMKKALADSIQAIINNEISVRKCILCDRIFRVPKVRGDRKKYCGSGCRSKASKDKNREDRNLCSISLTPPQTSKK